MTNRAAQAGAIAAGLVSAFWILNWLAVYLFSYPFLYCWGQPVMSPLFSAFHNIANLLIIAVAVVLTLAGKIPQVLGLVIIYVIILALPQFGDIVFKLGGSCG